MRMHSTVALMLIAAALPAADAARAATFAPPMLDISRQCNAMAHRNTALMSECVVAESEARADLLQHWERLPDASVERCLQAGKKVKRQPYVALEKCLSPDPRRRRRDAGETTGKMSEADALSLLCIARAGTAGLLNRG